MLIFVDKRLPAALKKSLNRFGETVDFFTEGIVYEAVSGHPDIFFHKSDDKIIYAPNTPVRYLKLLQQSELNLICGEKPLGEKYPHTVLYNALADDEKFYCNESHIDSSIKELHAGKTLVNLKQGYVACNMILGRNSVLSSDKGICKITGAAYFNPGKILLAGVKHGFIGGSCSIFKDKLLVNGSLKHSGDPAVLEKFAEDNELEIIELYDGPLIDGGGLLLL